MNILKVATKIALAIPVIPAVGGVFSNRRRASARLCAPADVSYNVSDIFFRWINRTPGGGNSAVYRDEDGKYTGSINREP